MFLVRGILDRIILVAAIVAAGCVPGFIVQYRQRVGGQLDQVLRDIAPFQQIANQFHHGSLEELVRYHVSSADPTFRSEGAALQQMVAAADRLRAAFDALNTDLFHQLVYLLVQIDPSTARATWDAFSPSFDLTAQSIAFALIAGMAIWLVFFAVWYSFARLIAIFAAR
jgi:hypothetical protein